MSSVRYSISKAVAGTAAPPIPRARAWAQEYLSSSPSQPLLDLSQGVPRDPPHSSFTAALSSVCQDPDSSRYGPIAGEPALRSAYAEEMNVLYRLSETHRITPQDVSITTGCNMAFLTVLMALCPPNQSSVLLPLPAYFNHGMSLSLQSVQAIYIPTDPEDRFMPSLKTARTYLASAKESGSEVKPRMIMLVSPSNPTGTVFSNEELKRWSELAREYEVALVLDETYREFVEADEGDNDGEERMGRPHRLFEEDDWRSTVISLGSFSKGYRIPGHRLGSIIAAPELLTHITTICDCMQLAIAPLLPTLRSDLTTSSLALTNRRNLFKQTVEAVQGWKVASMGGFYAYVSFPSDYLFASSTQGLKRKRLGSEDIAKMLARRCGVVVLPGSFFMPPVGDDEVWEGIVDGERLREDRWIRFAVANVLDEDVKQLGDRLRQLNEIMGMDEADE